MSEPQTTPPTVSSLWRVEHFGIRVPDFEAAIAWYTKTLDLRVTDIFPLGDKRVAFFAPADGEAFTFEVIAGPGAGEKAPFDDLVGSLDRDGLHHVCFRVRDVDGVVEVLRRRGARIVGEPRDVPHIDRRFAFFADPWGNLIELTEPIGDRRTPAS